MATRSALQTEVNSNIPDNNVGAVTPALLRTTLNDILTNVATLADADTISGVKSMAPPPPFHRQYQLLEIIVLFPFLTVVALEWD